MTYRFALFFRMLLDSARRATGTLLRVTGTALRLAGCAPRPPAELSLGGASDPDSLRSLGEGGAITVTVRGKNLIDETDQSKTPGTEEVTLADGSVVHCYTLKGYLYGNGTDESSMIVRCSLGAGSYRMRFAVVVNHPEQSDRNHFSYVLYYADGTTRQGLPFATGEFAEAFTRLDRTVTVTASKDVKAISFGWYKNGVSGALIAGTLQIEEGSAATAYEPYIAPYALLSLPTGTVLRAIGDRCDCFVLGTGVLRRIAAVSFAAEESEKILPGTIPLGCAVGEVYTGTVLGELPDGVQLSVCRSGESETTVTLTRAEESTPTAVGLLFACEERLIPLFRGCAALPRGTALLAVGEADAAGETGVTSETGETGETGETEETADPADSSVALPDAPLSIAYFEE